MNCKISTAHAFAPGQYSAVLGTIGMPVSAGGTSHPPRAFGQDEKFASFGDWILAVDDVPAVVYPLVKLSAEGMVAGVCAAICVYLPPVALRSSARMCSRLNDVNHCC